MSLLNRFLGTNSPSEPEEQIRERLENSDITIQCFGSIVSRFFLPNTKIEDEIQPTGDLYQFLVADSANRSVLIKVYPEFISIKATSVTWNRTGLLSTEPEISSDESGYSFGASGISDLPSLKYAEVLEDIIYRHLLDFLPEYEIFHDKVLSLKKDASPIVDMLKAKANALLTGSENGIKITLKESAKKTW